MRKLFYQLPILLVFIFQGCLKDDLTRTYKVFVPVYKSKAEVYANIKSNPPQAVQTPGKLFIIGNYIFLNDLNKGVHVIDNSNPASPVIKTFIDIPGNVDIAVRGNTLYADLYSDLVVVDITDPLQARFIKYIPRVFPERYYGGGFYSDSSKVLVDWVAKDTTVKLNRPDKNYDMVFLSSFQNAGGGPRNFSGVMNATGPVGIAGSMARFSVVNDYLYAVNYTSLRSFNISNNQNPVSTATNQLGWNIETIYPFNNRLFIGSQTGMFIYDITNPATPTAMGQFIHVRSCDPVIADNNYAYVTLRNGTACLGFNNQLDLVNVNNLNAPVLAKTYQLTNPHGLTKDGNLLFICDGRDGLKIYNASDPMNLILKRTISGIETFDAIAWNNNLLVVAKDGLYQYDYSNPDNITLRSRLSINR
jgi:hypothetical protein